MNLDCGGGSEILRGEYALERGADGGQALGVSVALFNQRLAPGKNSPPLKAGKVFCQNVRYGEAAANSGSSGACP